MTLQVTLHLGTFVLRQTALNWTGSGTDSGASSHRSAERQLGRSPYLRVIALRRDASQYPRMKKRILATFLWFLAGWYAGNVIAYALDVSAILGPILGVAAAGLIAGDPRGIIWSRRSSASTTPAATPSSSQQKLA